MLFQLYNHLWNVFPNLVTKLVVEDIALKTFLVYGGGSYNEL
jgi:hypothetical protein